MSAQSQELRNTDVEKVGGKSASLGEMISQLSDVGVPVPGGVTANQTNQERMFAIFWGVELEIGGMFSVIWEWYSIVYMRYLHPTLLSF